MHLPKKLALTSHTTVIYKIRDKEFMKPPERQRKEPVLSKGSPVNGAST